MSPMSVNLKSLAWKLRGRFKMNPQEISELLSDGHCFKKGKRYELRLPPKLMPPQRLGAGDVEEMLVRLDERLGRNSPRLRLFKTIHPFELVEAGDTRILKLKEAEGRSMIDDSLFLEDDLSLKENLEFNYRRARRSFARKPFD